MPNDPAAPRPEVKGPRLPDTVTVTALNPYAPHTGQGICGIVIPVLPPLYAEAKFALQDAGHISSLLPNAVEGTFVKPRESLHQGGRMKHPLEKIALALIAVIPISAQAQFAKPEDAVKYRQSVMSVISTHTGRIGAVVKGEKPYDKIALEADAAIIELLARLPWQAFTPGSELQNSKAKPEIWQEQEKFREISDRLREDSSRLTAAARSGNLVSIRAAFGDMTQSCKACHDNFRRK